MDAESDDSERWEDFFGSSTELAPSLLGLYDSLTQALDENLNSLKVSGNYVNDFDVVQPSYKYEPIECLKINDYTPVYAGNERSFNEKSSYSLSAKRNCEIERQNSKQFAENRVNYRENSPGVNKPRIGLSQNVRSIISHLGAYPVQSIDIEPVKPQSPAQSPERYTRKPLYLNSQKLKYSHIPLSKTAVQLTQSNNDLVETFRTHSSESLNKTKDISKSTKTMAADVDDNKTPTNNDRSFIFDLLRRQTFFKTESEDAKHFVEMAKLNTNSTMKITQNKIESKTSLDSCDISRQRSDDMPFIEHERKSSVISSTELIEAVNLPLVSKSLGRSLSDGSSPLLTYARMKNMTGKAITLPATTGIKMPSHKQLEQLAAAEEASELSAESLDRLTDIKPRFSPKESRRLTSILLPDVAKLKHRPLSSSSICSTSSSSSSGSDQLTKLTTSYLASVESLADQSENELAEQHISMSVFERCCLEIVESERSYVADLGQVIRGYLRDWKERACLSYDQLSILFSNIEDIYAFNTALLKRLNESGINPVRIAKCFIDMQAGFEVYTTYCTSYPDAISLLTKLLQATHTNSLLTSTQKMLQHTLPLGSYLLKPVQRILKYHLLLDNLCKYCDVKEVHQAYEIMRQVARHIDQVKRKLEQQSRVKELSGILDGWMGPELTVLGELRQEGMLLEHNKPRRVFLFGTMLIITKPKEDNRLQFKSYIHQNNLMLREHLRGEPTSFCVIPYDEPRNQIKLTCKNRDQKRLWAQNIKGVILEKFDNIPKRAKDLVYKLGDEEDRPADKNTWKWGLHSTPTPVYLERRNQCRRSEIRNRTKYKRKTLSTSNGIESFGELKEPKNDAATIDCSNAHDNINSYEAIKTRDSIKADEEKNCNAHEFQGHETAGDFRLLKERSKSVPKINCSPAEEIENEEQQSSLPVNTNLDSRKSKSSKTIDVKQFTQKALPKRIATLRKQRNTNKKETSKFYADLNDFSDSSETVLKITESSENIVEPANGEIKHDMEKTDISSSMPDVLKTSVNQEMEDNTAAVEKCKDDFQIIMDLLKNSKDFERFYNKSQKKRSNDTTSIKSFNKEFKITDDIPPRPPSRSPPPLEIEEKLKPAIQTHENTKADTEEVEEEPLYESLRRNVHVPYKFSPVFVRSKSAQYYNQREKNRLASYRPESDYVTLVYSPNGLLQKVGEDKVHTSAISLNNKDFDISNTLENSSSNTSSSSTLKRESITKASLISKNDQSIVDDDDDQPLYALPVSKKQAQRFSKSEVALAPTHMRSMFNSINFSRKPPERRASDVSNMFGQNIIHRQGSEAVGERMANTDYADPRQLFGFNCNSQSSLQRDSFFSLTSSNDSVCRSDSKRSATTSLNNSIHFDYEDNVEACLERDFRDSAIYSDDNEKRFDIDTTTYAHYCPPFPLVSEINIKSIPYDQLKRTKSAVTTTTTATKTTPSTSSSKSWVLQQIENFSK